MQHRQVLCRQVYANRSLTVQPYRCRHLEKPETTSTCQLKICSEWQIRTDWTSVRGLPLPPRLPAPRGARRRGACQLRLQMTGTPAAGRSSGQCG